MARATCVYCGAVLSSDVLEEAAQAAQRVLHSKSLAGLEAAAKGFGENAPRRYIIIDTAEASGETIAEACQVYVASHNRRLSFEWALIDGVNDRPTDAEELARYARPLAAHEHLRQLLTPTPAMPVRARTRISSGLDIP